MPAAAVIPAPIAYIKVVAVKTLVVKLLYCMRYMLFLQHDALCDAFLGCMLVPMNMMV